MFIINTVAADARFRPVNSSQIIIMCSYGYELRSVAATLLQPISTVSNEDLR